VLNRSHENGLSTTPDCLTARERQVIALVAAGRTGKEIAAALGISLRTARAHRENLGRKLGSSSTAWLTRYAILNGIDSESPTGGMTT
jgi:two-component system nitrate/nitrite response regulator NarL